ncbi:glycosyltransferase [Chryseobacterium balustinum]|uniref:Glycosyltransferase involved in cell wall bisynthesis n=1 Tax=Chryseobacterium balustinum TaxID=246 RepID=A0AAX2IGZ9_9FLAO|nr:glycosyltransferase [Chryseobacterium balustinum]AZB31087.1 glycosyltransferase family 4 protein [Chryseobacterium balustinum]SKB40390.1 Glycosyltransferase involved in cell wall bisynthesis [Chryseobacterium balustinum]SQA87804.1 Probable poly(glycerol-phosphate) alpha-glucosyltransferase [Chryseobacterium balustinum]
MQKKILFIYYQNLKPGGVARVMINLANELCENDYDISILFLMEGDHTFYEINPKIKIHTVDSFRHWGFDKVNPLLDKYLKKFRYRYNLKKYVYDFGQWDMMNQWLKKNHSQFDVIISCWYKLSAQISVNKTIASKTFAWEHSNFEVGGKIWGDLLRPKYKNLAGIVCINKASFNYYKTLNPNSYLIPNIIGEPFESIKNVDFESKINQLIYVGRLDQEKNVSAIITIISQINLNDFHLKIIGEGPEMENLKKQVEEKRLASKVTFTGRLPINEIKNELLKSKIFLFTSVNEAFGMVLLEAMFCGNALISYDCNYGPSDIINQNNGFLIPLNNQSLFIEKLSSVIENNTRLNNLIKTSFKDSEKWKKETALKEWKTILNF